MSKLITINSQIEKFPIVVKLGGKLKKNIPRFYKPHNQFISMLSTFVDHVRGL